jgi:predicted enzyme related to lactoylglutathione lyase
MSLSPVNGQPCWLDVSVKTTAEREELMAFLGSVFDWTFDVSGPDMGFYTTALRDGVPVCGIGENPEGAGVWVTYLATDNIVQSVEAVTTAGGNVFVPPMQVGDAGAMALALDPAGAVFGLWQEVDFGGFGAYGQVNGPCWFDHVSDAPEEAGAFYAAAFGRTVAPMTDMGGDLIMLGADDGVASFSLRNDEQATAWTPIIGVSSLVDAEERAVSHGGSVVFSGMDVPGGKVSGLAGAGTLVIVYESPGLTA